MIDKKTFKKIEFYLYNYHNIDELIKQTEMDIMDCTNISATSWIRGIKNNSANTVENQAIRIIDSKRIKDYKRWKILLRKLLKILREKKPKIYAFIKAKYFEKDTKEDITEKLKISVEIQKDITKKVVSFIYRYAKKEGLEVLV